VDAAPRIVGHALMAGAFFFCLQKFALGESLATSVIWALAGAAGAAVLAPPAKRSSGTKLLSAVRKTSEETQGKPWPTSVSTFVQCVIRLNGSSDINILNSGLTRTRSRGFPYPRQLVA
jgi:hypothetical protein